jgi:hypothetical protein
MYRDNRMNRDAGKEEFSKIRSENNARSRKMEWHDI